MASKREAKKQAKIEQEKAALECELRLLAIGAHGMRNIEDDPENGISIYNTIGCEAWARWIASIVSVWEIGEKYTSENGEDLRRYPWLTAPHNLSKFQSIQAATEFLYGAGCRAGGEWV